MIRALLLITITAFGCQIANAQSVSLQAGDNIFKTSAISINTDGSLPKAKLHIKGVGNLPTITQFNSPAFTSITAEAIPLSTSSEVFSIYGFANNSRLQNVGLFGHVGNSGIFNTALFGIAQDDGANDNYGLKTYAANAGTGAAFGVFGSVYGDSPSRARYGIYGEAYGNGLKYAGYFDGNVTITGNVTLLSDEKFKTNIKQLNNSLGLVMQLNPSTYQYQNTQVAGVTLPSGNHSGFVAQELQKVLPDLVSTNIHPARYDAITKQKKSDEQRYLSVNYIEIIPILVKAMQEQQAQIEALKKEVSQIKNK